MGKIRDYATQYWEGLISSREFLGHVMVAIGNEWQKGDGGDCDKLADELMKQLRK